MSVTRYQSKIRYYREVIQATNTTHNRVRFRKLDGSYVTTTGATVTASSNPTSGNLLNLLTPTGESCVFGSDKIITITVDLKQAHEVNAIEVRHATSGTFNKVLVQASTDGVSWYTLYDSTLDGTYPEVTAGVLFNSSYEIEVADRSAIILDVEDNAPFDPKQMIWENDKKLMDYFESLVERAQHYILGSSSTNKALILESLTGLYPASYFESMMVYWVHRTTADSINDATIKVGNLVAKPLIQQGQETITLTEGEPYIAIYDISIGKFKLLSGGGSGLAGKIDTVQATNNFSKYDLGAFDKATGTFVSPDLNLENPILAEAILLPKSYGFEGYINGMVEIPGMLDVDGNAIESGEVYFVSQTNNKKVTKVQPEGGLVQPFMQTYMSRGKLYAMLMQTDSFYGDSGTVWTSGRGFRTNGNVLELDAVDGEVRTDLPRFEVAVTEKDLVSYTGRSVDTIEDLKKVKHAKIGDIVFITGFHAKGDGSHHKRIAKDKDDGSGELGQGGIWWCIVHSGEVNVSWFGAKGDGVTDDTLSIQKATLYATNKTLVSGDITKTYCISDVIIAVKLNNIKLKAMANIEYVLITKEWTETHSMKNIHIDSNNLAKVGFKIEKSLRGNFRDFKIENSVEKNLLIEDNVYFNVFENFISKNSDYLFSIECNTSESSAPYYLCNNNSFRDFTLNGFKKRAILIRGASNNVFQRFNLEESAISVAQPSIFEITRASLNRFDTFWVECGYENTNYSSYLMYMSDYFSRDLTRGNEFNNFLIAPTSSTGTARPNAFYIGNALDTIFDNIEFNRVDNGVTFGSKSKNTDIRKMSFKDMSGDRYILGGINNIISETLLFKQNLTWSGASVSIPVSKDSKYKILCNYNISSFNSVSDQKQLNLYAYKYNDRIQIFSQSPNNNNVYIDLEVMQVYTGQDDVLNQNVEIPLFLTTLDTPYYTRKMEKEGIYEDFVDYMDSLNANPLTRPSEPQPSERLLEFAKRYGIN